MEACMSGNEKNPEASLAIQVLPKTRDDAELLRIVDAVISYIKSTGLKTFVGPFETTIEGSFEKLNEIACEAQKICIREGAKSVSTNMKWVYAPGSGTWSIEEKTAKYHG